MDVRKIFSELEENIIAAAIIFMAIMQFLNVIVRNVIPAWDGIPQELAVFAYIWVSFLCLSYSAKKGCHVIVSVIADKYNKKVRNILEYVQFIVDGTLAILFLYGSFIFVNQTRLDGITGITNIPLWIIYTAPIFGYGLSIIRDVQGIINLIKKGREIC